jgi:hypothetical protein
VEEAKREAYSKGKAYRDAIEGSIPQSMIDQHVTLAKAEERAFILNVLDGIDIADGECNTKAIRECLKARVV